MRTSVTSATLVVASLFAPGLFGDSLAAQEEVPPAVREAITATALDYIEGFYEANPERMARAVHEDLAKRIAMPLPDGTRRLDHMGKDTLVAYTRRNQPGQKVDLRDNVKILDVFGAAAVVRVDADRWVDFLQMAKLDDRWVIVNVLWELRPETEGGR